MNRCEHIPGALDYVSSRIQDAFSPVPLELLSLCFAAIKIPLIPASSWLPDAHVDSSTEGSILLAAVVMKTAAFYLLRFHLLEAICLQSFMSLWLLALLFCSFGLMRQYDLKVCVALLSIIHMSIPLLAVCSGAI
jgi:NADH-quinone oxidoreductase subunit M